MRPGGPARSGRGRGAVRDAAGVRQAPPHGPTVRLRESKGVVRQTDQLAAAAKLTKEQARQLRQKHAAQLAAMRRSCVRPGHF